GIESLLKGIAPLDDATVALVKARIGSEIQIPLWFLGFGALGVILFCVGCVVGTQYGVGYRVRAYPTVRELLGDTAIDPPLDPQELGELHALRWHLEWNYIPESEVETIFAEIIRPIVRKRSIRPASLPGDSTPPAPAPALPMVAAEPGTDFYRSFRLSQVVS